MFRAVTNIKFGQADGTTVWISAGEVGDFADLPVEELLANGALEPTTEVVVVAPEVDDDDDDEDDDE